MCPRRSPSWGPDMAYNPADLLPDPEAAFIRETILPRSYPPSKKKITLSLVNIDAHGEPLSLNLLNIVWTQAILEGYQPSHLWADADVIDQIRVILRGFPSFGGANDYRQAQFMDLCGDYTRILLTVGIRHSDLKVILHLRGFTLQNYHENPTNMGNLVTSEILYKSLVGPSGEIIPIPRGPSPGRPLRKQRGYQ